MMPRRSLLSLGRTLTALALINARASAQQTDSMRTNRHFFTVGDAAVMGVGVVGSAALSAFDTRIAHWMQSSAVQGSQGRHDFVSRVTKVNETTLTLAGVGMYAVGRLTHTRAVTDIALHTTEAIVLTSVASQLIRGPLGRSRPSFTRDSNQYDFHFMKGFGNFTYRAFPSLHSATAFAAGAALVAEVDERHPSGMWYAAPLLYGAATLPGLSRMYLDQHWASDVVMGGVVGVLLGSKVVRYSHANKPNRIGRALLGTRLLPDDRGGTTLALRIPF